MGWGAGGRIALGGAEGGVYSSGTIDVAGSVSGVSGGEGGRFRYYL